MSLRGFDIRSPPPISKSPMNANITNQFKRTNKKFKVKKKVKITDQKKDNKNNESFKIQKSFTNINNKETI